MTKSRLTQLLNQANRGCSGNPYTLFCGSFGLAGSVLTLFRDARLACDFSVGADWTAYLFFVEPISLAVPVSSGYRMQF